MKGPITPKTCTRRALVLKCGAATNLLCLMDAARLMDIAGDDVSGTNHTSVSESETHTKDDFGMMVLGFRGLGHTDGIAGIEGIGILPEP